MTDRALVTGITGQDGSYLTEYLLNQGYEVHGIIRRASTFNTARIDHIYEDPHNKDVRLFLHFGDIGDYASLTTLVRTIEPTEIYNLAAQSHVRVSFDLPIYTGQVTGIGTTCLLEAIRKSDINVRFYQASSSEIFGSSPPPQNEDTPLHPRSPYAAAKVYAYWIAINYREAYGLHASNGILFNHESPRRGETFVTRKITRAVANIMAGNQDKLFMGNLDARRDWGYAPEYVMSMVKILKSKEPDDFVIGTGSSYSVKDFLEFCFDYVGLAWEDYVELDKKYLRPSEVDYLESDPSKAKRMLGWEAKVQTPELAKIMMDNDMIRLGLEPPGEGNEILESLDLKWFSEPDNGYRI
ncbi:MAG: GDP-mannose 4,6-dehydratase [Candidatus Thorarchaeota archaeon]